MWHKYSVGIGAALLAVLVSIALFSFLGSFQRVFLSSELLSKASPWGILAVCAMLLFGGIYLFNAAGKIVKETVK